MTLEARLAALPRSTGRLTGLDALRGLAAASVVFFHCMLAIPATARGAGGEEDPPFDLLWLVAYTPLRVYWLGGVAVMFFFALSGFVLTRASSGHVRWADYYPRRMLRLYVPVVGAVLLATMWAVVVPRPAPSSATSWVRSADEPSGIGIARDIALVWEPGSTTSVLWSLTWEVLFSLLLPIYLVVVAPSAGSTRAVVIGIVVSIAMSAVGEVYGVNALRFLPVFAIGCYLAVLDHRVWSAMASWWRGLPKWMRAIAFFLLIAGICSPYTMTGLGLDGPIARAVGRSAMLASCAVAVCFGVLWTVPRDSRLGSSLRWMGSRSFALYLVHEPIVVSAAILGAGRVSAWWSMPIAISVALVVTEVFYRVVERPSTAFARSFSLPGLRQVGGGSS